MGACAPTVLSLCSGIGGFDLGLRRAGFRTVCYVEKNPYRQKVLQARIADNELDDAPIWDDVTTFDGSIWSGVIHTLATGFPCQPFSIAGTRQGTEDERYLWPSIYNIICDSRPRYVLMENVPGLLMAGDERPAPVSAIFSDLAQAGYDAEWASISASAFGLPHRRERVFIVAHTRQRRRARILGSDIPDRLQARYHREATAYYSLDAVCNLVSQVEQRMGQPSVFGDRDVVSNRVERLEAIGESVVPPIAEYIGSCILAADAKREG